MTRSGVAERAAVEYLRSPVAIRERVGNVLAAGLADQLEHFAVRPDRLDPVAERVVEVTRAAYPDLAIPYHSRWGHFGAGGVDRLAELDRLTAAMSAQERARTRFDLVITSVLLDAGAGPRWRYREPGTGVEIGRSEGLAVASFRMFLAGAFSSDPARPLRADAAGLAAITAADIAAGFQVAGDNPLVGLEGRAALLSALGAAVAADRERFGEPARIGGLFDFLRARATGGALPAPAILEAVLVGLGSIWPGRLRIGPVNLGDVWHHPAAGGDGPSAQMVPLHKLSQWLTYSLFEPLEDAGLRVSEQDALTGLAEYRNGGLLLDLGLLAPRHDRVLAGEHRPGDPIIVEWRALTVALLDRIADRVRQRLGLDADRLPLARVLEGGTWRAGREVARERREDASPPIRIASDGTVF
jgi:hypothetical protein